MHRHLVTSLFFLSTLAACSEQESGKASAAFRQYVRDIALQCADMHVEIGNELWSAETRMADEDEIDQISYWEIANPGFSVVRFEHRRPYPGAPSFFCSFNTATGEILEAGYEYDEGNRKLVTLSDWDWCEGCSDDERTNVLESRSSHSYSIREILQ